METNDILDQKPLLEVTENSKKHLKTTASWTNFYAILCFIGVAFLLLGGIMMLAMRNMMHGFGAVPFSGFTTIMGIIYIIMAIVMIFPALYLYRFSQRTTKALENHSTPLLEEAFLNMKSYWKFIGIVSIISIALCIIIIPIMIVVSASAMVF